MSPLLFGIFYVVFFSFFVGVLGCFLPCMRARITTTIMRHGKKVQSSSVFALETIKLVETVHVCPRSNWCMFWLSAPLPQYVTISHWQGEWEWEARKRMKTIDSTRKSSEKRKEKKRKRKERERPSRKVSFELGATTTAFCDSVPCVCHTSITYSPMA